jgi:hypothetical protein
MHGCGLLHVLCCRALLFPQGADAPLVPRFWLRVLKSADAAALAISPRDAAVLAALADVRFSLDTTPGASELQGKCKWLSTDQPIGCSKAREVDRRNCILAAQLLDCWLQVISRSGHVYWLAINLHLLLAAIIDTTACAFCPQGS